VSITLLDKTVEWRETDEGLKPFNLDDSAKEIIWCPQPGSQEAFLSCPVFECLYEGTRGPGKTDALLMDFVQHVGQGFGSDWRGIIFRQTYKQLNDIVDKSKKWFGRIFGDTKKMFNSTDMQWTFPSGEVLLLRYMMRKQDYDNYHGHSYPFIGFEELTNWPTPDCYTVMMSCCRSTNPKMPRKYRATTNPFGKGHNWVKKRWRLPISSGVVGPIIKDSVNMDGEVEPPRVAIHGDINENRILLTADPNYITNIKAAARNRSELRAWVYGDWNITAGGMFDDIWEPAIHVIPNIRPTMIPKGWTIDRSYDHGSSKPFSVGWWAESNGEPITVDGRTVGLVRGDIIRFAEWYGCTPHVDNEGLRMLAKEIAQGILDRESDMGIKGRVKKGPADSSIFSDYEPKKSVYGDMKKVGVVWKKVDKAKGSRVQGWELIRKLLKDAIPGIEGVRESPGMFICDRCVDFIRTVPVLPRDEKDIDDVDTEAEDHIGDEVRYRVRHISKTTKQESW